MSSRTVRPIRERVDTKGTTTMLTLARSEMIQMFRNRLVLVTGLVIPVEIGHEQVHEPRVVPVDGGMGLAQQLLDEFQHRVRLHRLAVSCVFERSARTEEERVRRKPQLVAREQRGVAGALREGKLGEAVKLAERYKKSHLAKVVVAGLQEFQAHDGETSFLWAIADVKDRARMDELMAQHCPSVVFHAAAYKHVPLMEVRIAATRADATF